MEYDPINYTEWILGDAARSGANLKRLGLLDSDEWKIYQEALPYQDARDDPGQAEIVTYFALELMRHLPGIREIVVPSAILHDIGFHYGRSEEWKALMASGKNIETEEIRRPHQNRGIMLAGRILERVEYNRNYLCEIADIIGDHDTRKLPTTESGRIMRAADLIWRVSYPWARIYLLDSDLDETLGQMKKWCLEASGAFQLGKVEKNIARVEAVNTLVYKFGEKAGEKLKSEFQPELDSIRDFVAENYHINI